MTDDKPADGEAMTFPACQKHGIHRNGLMLQIDGHPSGGIAYCNICLIEALDSAGVGRMGIVELTKEQFEQLQSQEAAE